MATTLNSRTKAAAADPNISKLKGSNGQSGFARDFANLTSSMRHVVMKQREGPREGYGAQITHPETP